MLIALRCWQRATLVTVSQNPPGRVSAGRILDPNTSRSQILGGTAFGTGMALMEQTYYDPRSGSPANSSLGDYLLPTCAVMPQSDTSFIAHPDFAFNLLGIRGIGEIGNHRRRGNNRQRCPSRHPHPPPQPSYHSR